MATAVWFPWPSESLLRAYSVPAAYAGIRDTVTTQRLKKRIPLRRPPPLPIGAYRLIVLSDRLQEA